MYDEPQEDPSEQSLDPKAQARDKSDEFRMHAELASVFEGPRKFEAQIVPGLDPELAREIQRTVGRLEKAKTPDSPVLPQPVAQDAANVLGMARSGELSTNDYHIHRRPGEVMIVRWLEGQQVETYYERLQAHFDAAMNGYREEERSAQEWKQDSKTLAYLDELDAIEVKMADRYLRSEIRKFNLFVLSTQTADEINIAYLADTILGVSPAEIVGDASAPPEEPTEQDLAWFFKLFSLRGIVDEVERMCFFTFLQKTDEGW